MKEYYFIIIIGVFQFIAFGYTLRKILLFGNVFPDTKFLTSTKFLSKDEIVGLNKESYSKLSSTKEELKNSSHFSYLKTNESYNLVFKKIIKNINWYIFKNVDSTDFNVVEAIIERENDAIENTILSTVSIPLYLGLMGTMLGVVIGLFNIDTNAITDTNGIISILSAVQWAMIISISGLLLMLINNSLIYRWSKNKHIELKNNFYNFLQAELFPQLSGLEPIITTFKNQLDAFNTSFGDNIDGFNEAMTLMNKNYKSQENLLKEVSKINIHDLTRANFEMSQVLNHNIKSFESFNKNITHSQESFSKFKEYLDQINTYVDATNALVDKSHQIHDNLATFGASAKDTAEGIKSRLDQSNKLVEYLSSHFDGLENSKTAFGKALDHVDETFVSSINNLTQNSSKALEDHLSALSKNSENFNRVFENYGLEFANQLQAVLNTMVANLNSLTEQNEKLNLGTVESLEQKQIEIPKLMNGIDDALKEGVTNIEDIFSDFQGKLKLDQYDPDILLNSGIKKEDLDTFSNQITKENDNHLDQIKKKLDLVVDAISLSKEQKTSSKKTKDKKKPNIDNNGNSVSKENLNSISPQEYVNPINNSGKKTPQELDNLTNLNGQGKKVWYEKIDSFLIKTFKFKK